MHMRYSFAYLTHVLVGVGKEKKSNTKLYEWLLFTGTQEVPALKSVQKSPGSFRFGQLEIFISRECCV